MQRRYLGLLIVGLAIAAVIALFSPLASADPDGLEKVAEDNGFLEAAKDAPYEILPDYSIPGVDNENVSTILAGLIGVAAVGGGTLLVAQFLSRRQRDVGPPAIGGGQPRQD